MNNDPMQLIMNSVPMACCIIEEVNNGFFIVECNQELTKLFALPPLRDRPHDYLHITPTYQPDGRLSREKIREYYLTAREMGRVNYEWMHCTPDGVQIPCGVRLSHVRYGTRDIIVAYIRDLRELIESMVMRQQLEDIAYTDALTGVSSRRFFVERAEKALAASHEDNIPYHILMIDLDYFKKVNDTYGHPVGDEVLKITATRMRHALRKDTLLARYGGEEFIVMLTHMDIASAVKTASRLHKSIEEAPYMTAGHTIPLTVSIGLAHKTCPTQTLSVLIDHADQALYAAKRGGRNRVVKYS